MSLPEKPRKLPAEYDARAIEQVIQDIYTALNSGFRHTFYQMNSVAPERTKNGMVVFADGTDYEPVTGYGRGFYWYGTTGAARRFLTHDRPLIDNPMFQGTPYYSQPTPIVKNTANGTLTGANMLRKTVEYTSTGGNLTTETGALIEADITSDISDVLTNNYAFDFSIVNTGSGTVTVVAGASGVTLSGRMTVAAGTEGYFQCLKTATDTYTITRRG
jgi:hypothetical protein